MRHFLPWQTDQHAWVRLGGEEFDDGHFMDDTSVVLRCRLGEPYEWFDPYQMVNVEAEVPGLGITHMQPYVPTLVRIPEV